MEKQEGGAGQQANEPGAPAVGGPRKAWPHPREALCFCAGAESAFPPRGTAHILGTSAARDVLRRINAVAPVVEELLS